MDIALVTLKPDEQQWPHVQTELLAGQLMTIEAALALDISISHEFPLPLPDCQSRGRQARL